MARTSVENFQLVAANDQFSPWWKLTRCRKAAGCTTLASSSGLAKDTSGVNANDLWGGNASPLADAYPSAFSGRVTWIVQSGTTMATHSISAVPTVGPGGSNFIRGEPVVQATSGATGIFLGYSVASGTGWVVLDLCTGTFDATHTVTGQISGATYTPSAVAFWDEEWLFAKTSNLTQGLIARGIFNRATESAQKFSTLATSIGCTATVPPGMGGTGNAFPALGYMVRGTSAPSYVNWFGISASLVQPYAQLISGNLTPAANTPIDATWFCGVGNPNNGATGFEWVGHFRCDDQEPGDLDPHATYSTSTTLNNNASVRTDATVTNSPMSSATPQTQLGSGIAASWRGWLRRGFASGDSFCSYAPTFGCDSSGVQLQGFVTGSPARIACTFASPAELAPEELQLHAQQPFTKQYKGRPRWLQLQQGLTTFQASPDKTYKAISTQTATPSGLMIGLCDGSTTWLQA